MEDVIGICKEVNVLEQQVKAVKKALENNKKQHDTLESQLSSLVDELDKKNEECLKCLSDKVEKGVVEKLEKSKEELSL